MDKFWRVCIHEYLRHVLRKRFIIVVLSLPLGILAMAGFVFLLIFLMLDFKPIGYVDLSGWLANPRLLQANNTTDLFSRRAEIIPYANEESARQALDQGKIQAYYVLPADYLVGNQIRGVTKDSMSENANDDFYQFIRYNIISAIPEKIQNRLIAGAVITVRSATSDQQAGAQDWWTFLLPMGIGILFIIVINTSGGYLLQAVVEEKENRTMEIVITSVSTTQMMAGKIIGNLAVGLTQLLFWTVPPLLVFLFLRNSLPFLQSFQIPAQFVWLSIVTLLLAFIFVSAAMAAIGATVTEVREAQQISGLFTLPLVVPFWFIYSIMVAPNGPLAVALSLIPFTAPLALTMRAAYTDIPAWQIGLSLGLLALFSLGAIWLAGYIVRVGMLNYGKRLTFKEIFRRN